MAEASMTTIYDELVAERGDLLKEVQETAQAVEQDLTSAFRRIADPEQAAR